MGQPPLPTGRRLHNLGSKVAPSAYSRRQGHGAVPRPPRPAPQLARTARRTLAYLPAGGQDEGRGPLTPRPLPLRPPGIPFRLHVRTRGGACSRTDSFAALRPASEDESPDSAAAPLARALPPATLARVAPSVRPRPLTLRRLRAPCAVINPHGRLSSANRSRCEATAGCDTVVEKSPRLGTKRTTLRRRTIRRAAAWPPSTGREPTQTRATAGAGPLRNWGGT